MKKTLLINFMIILLVSFMWMGSSGGRATAADEGSTGAPGESTTCSNPYCHGNTNILSEVDIAIIGPDDTEMPRYFPGFEHTIRVTVNHVGGNTPAAYGFQLTALTDSNEQSAGNFFNPGSNVQIATASSTGRQYAEHTGPSGSNVFEVQWLAPEEGSGNITLYAGGNAVNGNGMPSGDGANNTSLSLYEEILPGNNNLVAKKWGLELYPNPVGSDMNLELNNDDGRYLMTIIDVSGRVVESRQVNFVNGKTNVSVDNLPMGNYSVLLRKEAEVAVINMVKL